MKRCQKGFLLSKKTFLHLYINAGLSRICKKSTSNCWFIARDGLEPIVHYLMDFSVLELHSRVISIYQICSYLTECYWIKWQRHYWKKDGFSLMKWKLDSCNKRKVYHSLAGKICGHEIRIKWNIINWVVESWKYLFLPYFRPQIRGTIYLLLLKHGRIEILDQTLCMDDMNCLNKNSWTVNNQS